MEIIDKYIVGTTLTLIFDDTVPSGAHVGIDNGENYMKNQDANKHDYTYDSPVINGKTISVTLPSKASALIIATVYAGNDTYCEAFLNRYMIFKAQNRFLAIRNCTKCDNSVCQDCNEKSWRTNMLTILLRTQLLNYAYENGLFYDTIDFYQGLIRLLNFNDILFESIPSFYNDLNKHATMLL